MKKLLEETDLLINGRVWNTATLQRVLESWNWALLLSQAVMSISEECHELASNERLSLSLKLSPKHEL